MACFLLVAFACNLFMTSRAMLPLSLQAWVAFMGHSAQHAAYTPHNTKLFVSFVDSSQ
eukprot:m.89196 g.89196  ORF g.89196 m.89196 type:complete len:58 (+) comp12884_c0_seq4:844-1017(+)